MFVHFAVYFSSPFFSIFFESYTVALAVVCFTLNSATWNQICSVYILTV